MREIFADTFYWIALANPSDEWHQPARDFNHADQDALLVTTHEVLTEFLNFFSAAGEKTRYVISEMCERTLNHPKIIVVPQTHDSFLKGFRLYYARPDKAYSLTDCISMHTMRERNISEVLTHDNHFRQEGFQILL